jgi:acetylornithine/N-succinyldiaminopimelate aminotransferase
VAFENSFHGRTMGAVAVTAREKYRLPFMPVMPDVRFARFNDVEGLASAIRDDVCAVIVEPLQGEGGINIASMEFLQRLRTLCDTHHALLMLDEIQCGMGRTGTLWAHEPYQVQPDIMVVAKPLASGMPIGAILARQHIADTIKPGDHGTTFGGGPLVTAVAHMVLRRISQPAFLEHVRQVGSYLDESLHDLAASHPDRIVELRGRGLMRGVQIHGSAAELRSALQHAGLLVATAGDDVVRLLPPLILEPHHVDEAIAKFRHVM